MSSEANAISKLKELLESKYEIEKIQPPVMASDAEVNIVIVTLLCPDGKPIRFPFLKYCYQQSILIWSPFFSYQFYKVSCRVSKVN